MTKEQALEILKVAAEQARMTKNDHAAVERAYQILKKELTEENVKK